MSKAFVYTEFHAPIPFADVPWRARNPILGALPGLRNKTWLAGVGSTSVGGLYEFDSIETGRSFVTGSVPATARSMGVSQTTRLFDGAVVAEASRALNSAHFGGVVTTRPGAFVYTEVQVSVAFDEAPWRAMIPVLRAQPGLLHKTWLSGVHTRSIGGFYAFDTVAHATRFCTDYFPTETAPMGVAYTTRIFDAAPTVEASRGLHSPFFV